MDISNYYSIIDNQDQSARGLSMKYTLLQNGSYFKLNLHVIVIKPDTE